MKNLKEILENEDKEMLMIYAKDHLGIEFKDTKEGLKKIEENIKERFSDFIDESFNFDYLNMINEVKKNKKSNSLLEDEFIDESFMFFDDDDNTLFPKELGDILRSKFTKEKQITLLNVVVFCYMDINIVMPEEFFNKNYIEKYNLDISLKDLDLDYTFVDGLMLINDRKELIDFYNNINDKCDYRILSDEDLLEAIRVRKKLENVIVKEIKDKETIENIYHELTFVLPEYPESIAQNLANKYKLSLKKANNIAEVYLDISQQMRFTLLRGRNAVDSMLDKCLETTISIKKREEFTVDKLLEINDFLKFQKIDKETLLESYKKVTEVDLLFLKVNESNDVNYDTFDIKNILNGRSYPVKLNGKLRYLMPIELKKIKDEKDKLKKSLEKKFNDNLFTIIYYIESYIEMNGIIKRDKLLELLEKNDIKITSKDLDEIMKYHKFDTEGDYLIDEVFTDEAINDLSILKDDFKDYKIIDDEQLDLKNEISELLTDYLIDADCLYEHIFYLIQFDAFNKKEFKNLLIEHNIHLNNKDLNDIYDELCYLSDITPLWTRNGFSRIECGEI